MSKEIEDLNNTINQLDLRDIYRIIHSITAEYSFQVRIQVYTGHTPGQIIH